MMRKSKRRGGWALLGALGYPALELLWRGRTDWSMALAGAFVLPGLARLARQRRGLSAALAGAGLITLVELGFGLLFNRWLRRGVWDYSQHRGQLWGQISPRASLRWLGLCLLLMPLLRRRGGNDAS